MEVDDKSGEEETSVRKSRRSSMRKPRTKGIVKKLQEQIEFYFGDSNLSKDRFLHQKIQDSPDGYVPVDVIADFKKMQSLTSDRSLIMKAIHNSSLVEVSDDGKSLRRCHPLPTFSQTDIDSRTIYVEKFPSHVNDHEMVTKMFRQFGDVCYVSLPRFKASGAIKGFAFIEFATKEAAEKALEYFKVKDTLPPNMKKRKPSKVMHYLSKDALGKISEEMETIGSGDDDEDDDIFVENGDGEIGKSDNSEDKDGGSGLPEKDSSGLNTEECRIPKRERTADEEENHAEGIKKIKTDEGVSPPVSEEVSECDKKEEEEGCVRTDEASQEKKSTAASDEESSRKRVRVDSEGKCGELADHSAAEEAPKEKRQKISDPKELIEGVGNEREVLEDKSCQDVGKEEGPLSGKDDEELEGNAENGKGKETERGGRRKRHRPHRKKPWGLALRDMDLRVMSKAEWSEMKEMFKSMQKSNFKKVKAATSSSTQDQLKPQKGFVKECLVKVELQKECEGQVKDMLKELCQKFGEVAFVDLKEGDKEGFVRYKSSGCVESLLLSESRLDGVSLQAMKEEEERAYYLKTMAERKQKFKVNKKKINQRGKDKLISKALKCVSSEVAGSSTNPAPTHIKFSDSEDGDMES